MEPICLGVPVGTALLDGELARRASAAADVLFGELCRTERRRPLCAGVGGGDAGIAVALAHWALRQGDEVEEVVAGRIARAMTLGRALPTSWDLYAGWSGIGWAADLLAAADDAVLESIDARVSAGIAAEADPALPLVEGLAGALVYAAQRGGGRVFAPLVTQGVDRLLAAAEPRAAGDTWPTHHNHVPDWLRARHPRGHDNLGTAHGAPGIVAALAGLLRADLLDLAQTRRVHAAIRATCTWIQSIRATDVSRLPAWVVDDEAPSTQIGWCYGDVGAAAALLTAARATADGEAERFALEMARAAIPRVEQWSHGELGLCHGHAGVTHVYHRLWRASGDSAFAAVARRGCETILAALQDRPMPLDDDGLLEGTAGVALVLEGACDDAKPTWDAILGCEST